MWFIIAKIYWTKWLLIFLGLSLEPDGAGGDSPGSMRKKKRKSRWGEESEDKSFIPGMPTVLPQGLEKDQEELFLRKFII